MTRIPFTSLRSFYLAGAALALLAAPAAAQQTLELSPLVVTATKSSVPADQVGSSITVITRQEIQEQNYQTLPEVLRNVPGLSVVQNGPQGALTAVFTRGSNSNHTLILLNGRPIADPSTPNGAFNFAHLPLFNVEQIEVLRGPASALYGSKAIGGVINIITRKGEGDPTFSGQVEVGTRNTLNSVLNANGALGGIGYDLTLSRLASDGFSVTPPAYRPFGAGSESDGYRNLSGSLGLSADLSDTLSASFFGAIVDTRFDNDPSPEDPNAREKTRQVILNGALSGSFFDGFWQPTLSIGYVDYDRNDKNSPDARYDGHSDVDNDGWSLSAELQNDLILDEQNRLSLGVAFERESFSSSGATQFDSFPPFPPFVLTQDSDAERDTIGVYAIHRFQWDDSFFLTSAVRFDAPEETENAVTFTIAPSYTFHQTGTTIRGSVGTAYKAPSLYELYGYSPDSTGSAFYGNPDLDPERSFGWEIGFDQRLFEDRLTLGATYFYNDIEDAIVTVYTPTFDSTTVNNQDLKAQGAEVYLDIRPIESVRLRLDYTYTHTEMEDTGKQALRRPKHSFGGSLAIDITDRLWVTGNFNAIGGRRDVGFYGGTVTPKAYTVVNAAIGYEMFDGVTLYARAENLLDQDYQPADGFAGPGLRLLVGLRTSY